MATAKDGIRIGDKVWAHHPRGGYEIGYACKVQRGLYSNERGIASSVALAKANEYHTSVPVGQLFLGDPPSSAHKQ